MRDANRIPLILKRLENVWLSIPDLRFGQLIENLGGTLYYYEDDELMNIMEIFYGIKKTKKKTKTKTKSKNKNTTQR